MRAISEYVFDDNVLNIYRFGSHVYGSTNRDSDEDFIVVAKEHFDSKDINIHVYTVSQFGLLLKRHDIQALECYFLDADNVLKNTHHFTHINGELFKIDKSLLRVAVSTIASNSWVKGKKKLTVAGDYDVNLAIKSTFHSLRILDFGTQIASTGEIQRYDSMNWLLEDLRKMATQYQREELWNKIDDKYRALYNEKSSLFKSLAPKDVSEKDKREQVYKVVRRANELLAGTLVDKYTDEIMTIFEK